MNLATTIALVSSSTNPKKFGTGFVVHQDDAYTYIVTCAHVVRDIEDRKTEATRILVNSLAAEVVALGEVNVLDLAVLRVPRLYDRNPLPLGRIEPGTGEGLDVRVAGQCSQTDRSAHVAEWLNGQLRKEVGLTSQQRSVQGWRLNFRDGDRVQPGYSGGPVFAGDRVVAVAAIQIKDGSEAIAISIDALQDIWTCSELEFSSIERAPSSSPTAANPHPPELPNPTASRTQTGIIFNDRSSGTFGSVTQNFGNVTQNFGSMPGFKDSAPRPALGASWDGQRKKEFRKALISVYPDYKELSVFVRDELKNLHLPTVTGESNIKTACFDLIEWAESKGRLEELYQAFLRDNSGREFSF